MPLIKVQLRSPGGYSDPTKKAGPGDALLLWPQLDCEGEAKIPALGEDLRKSSPCTSETGSL